MTLPFFGDLDDAEAQAFGNLIWTTVALEGLVNRVCRVLLGTAWREGRDIGLNITDAQAVALARGDRAGELANEWLTRARPKTHLRNQVLHSTLAAHMNPEDPGKVAFFSLHNIRWDGKAKAEVETYTPFSVANMETIRSEIAEAISGFMAVEFALVS